MKTSKDFWVGFSSGIIMFELIKGLIGIGILIVVYLNGSSA